MKRDKEKWIAIVNHIFISMLSHVISISIFHKNNINKIKVVFLTIISINSLTVLKYIIQETYIKDWNTQVYHTHMLIEQFVESIGWGNTICINCQHYLPNLL